MTEWEVAHDPKNGYPHISLKDTPWWVNKRGIICLLGSTFVLQKIRKNCSRCRPLPKWRTLVRRVLTQELRSWKVQKQVCFSSFCIFGKLFKPKTRIFRLIFNSRCVFKNRQYFTVLKSNFGAFFQDKFFLCGITPNHLRLMSWLVEMYRKKKSKLAFALFRSEVLVLILGAPMSMIF